MSLISTVTVDRRGGLTRRSPGFSDILASEKRTRYSPMSRVSAVRLNVSICAPGWYR
ncbi:hypothetical protein D3C84_1221910 [compost metagenome]